MKKYLVLILLIFMSCNAGDGGGGGGNGGKALLTIKISNDCNNLTECIDIYLDGELIEKDLKPGEVTSKEVEVGNHSIMAFGECDIYNVWESKIIYVPPEGHTEILSCISENKGVLNVKISSNCIDIVKKVMLYIDDQAMGEFFPNDEWIGYLNIGEHKIYAVSEKNDLWGPEYVNLLKEGLSKTLECNISREGILTLGVDQNCICNFIYGVRIYYSDPVKGENILAGSINPGQEISIKATVGYHRISAQALCHLDNKTYYFGPEEIYLPLSGFRFIIPCNQFSP